MNIPAEMIEEILVNLPVKSLLRFKCVGKGWRALTESRSFIHRHYCNDSNQERLLFVRGEYEDDQQKECCDDRVMVSYFGKDTRQRMGSVNGLFCEVSVSGDMVLLNPATRKLKRVPPPPFNFQGPVDDDMRFGFGLDGLSGDYKMVVFGRDADEFVWVYNSGSDCWKSFESPSIINTAREYLYMDDTFSNGVYYWRLEVVEDEEEEEEEAAYIVSFDMKSERFQKINYPHGVRIANISAYGDSIALFSWGNRINKLWVMGKHGIWREISPLGNQFWLWRMVCVWKNEVLFRNYRDQNIILMDITTQKITSLAKHVGDLYPRPAFCYKESLVSIKGEENA